MGNNYNEQAHFFHLMFILFEKAALIFKLLIIKRKKLWN